MRLVFTLALFALCVGGAALFVFSDTIDPSGNLAALVVFNDTESECQEALRADYPNLRPNDVEVRSTDLDGDGEDDHLVRFTASEYCGTGGCLYELCKKNEGGGVEHVPFGYAAHTLEIQNTLTNGMRDIMVNDDESLLLQWNGTKYELTN